MVKVDGSVFLSGPSNDPLWLPEFYIDVHSVSNADYARFIAATGHSAPQHWTTDGAASRRTLATTLSYSSPGMVPPRTRNGQ
jgi:formylglycine-generating enzyme required for sulfatase activity